MIEKDKEYFINHPVFVKYKTKFNFLKMTRIKRMRKNFVNERIVEIPFVLGSLPSSKELKILDLGCSESALPLHMASIGYSVTGLDMRSFPYRHPKFEFVKSDITNMPFVDESFDVITCISTLEHIGLGYYKDSKGFSDADGKAAAEIHRVLKKNGLFIVSVPFGIYKENNQQRIYDIAKLEGIFLDFLIEEKVFFANFSKKGSNYWQEISQIQAENIESIDGNTNCICLLKGYKRS
jgi:SAM-dependent methyltransferase